MQIRCTPLCPRLEPKKWAENPAVEGRIRRDKKGDETPTRDGNVGDCWPAEAGRRGLEPIRPSVMRTEGGWPSVAHYPQHMAALIIEVIHKFADQIVKMLLTENKELSLNPESDLTFRAGKHFDD